MPADSEVTVDAWQTQTNRIRAFLIRAEDVSPGGDQLHHYWTRGEGLAKWVHSPHPFTTLVALLSKHVSPNRAKAMAAKWVHEVTGNWPGSDKHRVAHGHPPRGDRIGPG